jgi:protein-S-isoprenylcysteine O-methyltransferase Ste14
MRLAQEWPDLTAELQYLQVGHEILSIIFIAMLAVLFVIRRAPIGHRAPLPAQIVAIGGTFIGPVILAQSATIEDWRVLTAGNLLMICGLLFTIYSLGFLGRNFGMAPEARALVTSGAYRWVRNPVYLGEFVTVIGGMLSLLSPITLIIFAVLCLLQLCRIALEEQVLSATFPEYDDYRRRTPALVPWHLLRSSNASSILLRKPKSSAARFLRGARTPSAGLS